MSAKHRKRMSQSSALDDMLEEDTVPYADRYFYITKPKRQALDGDYGRIYDYEDMTNTVFQNEIREQQQEQQRRLREMTNDNNNSKSIQLLPATPLPQYLPQQYAPISMFQNPLFNNNMPQTLSQPPPLDRGTSSILACVLQNMVIDNKRANEYTMRKIRAIEDKLDQAIEFIVAQQHQKQQITFPHNSKFQLLNPVTPAITKKDTTLHADMSSLSPVVTTYPSVSLPLPPEFFTINFKKNFLNTNCDIVLNYTIVLKMANINRIISLFGAEASAVTNERVATGQLFPAQINQKILRLSQFAGTAFPREFFAANKTEIIKFLEQIPIQNTQQQQQQKHQLNPIIDSLNFVTVFSDSNEGRSYKDTLDYAFRHFLAIKYLATQFPVFIFHCLLCGVYIHP